MSGPTDSVDVCVCTFRRASLFETLHSLAAQRLPDDVALRVIVADNDDTARARPGIERVAVELGLDLRYIHAPARNISVARNAALDAATGRWVAILDDDEVASPDWIAELLHVARGTGADVVLGPVVALYRTSDPAWMTRGDFHSTQPVAVAGRYLTGYTSNVAFRRTAPAIAGERFRVDLGRSGGEDTEFFARVVGNGASIVYAPQAVVTERVEPTRASLGWLARRRFRSGQSHGMVLAQRDPSRLARARQVALAAAKLGACVAGTALALPSARWRAFWMLRASLHAGVVMRLLGTRELTQYGEDPDFAC